jgi:hypothetical protein
MVAGYSSYNVHILQLLIFMSLRHSDIHWRLEIYIEIQCENPYQFLMHFLVTTCLNVINAQISFRTRA